MGTEKIGAEVLVCWVYEALKTDGVNTYQILHAFLIPVVQETYKDMKGKLQKLT